MSIVALVVLSLALTGCLGAYQVPAAEPKGAGGLQPVLADTDAGLVGIARDLDLKRYLVIAVDRFQVAESDVKDDEDRRLAAELPPYLQSEIVRRLRASGLFERIVNLGETEFAPAGQQALRREGAITKFAPGSRALRYMVGFGAGASKAQIEKRLVDMATGEVVIVSADRREAAFGVFGGDSEEHLKEALSDMARDFAKFLARTRETGGTRPAAQRGAPPGAQVVAASLRFRGSWQGTLKFRTTSGPVMTLPVTLKIFEQNGALAWSLVRTGQGNSMTGAGAAEVDGDTLRLAGHFNRPPSEGSPSRVSVTYSGTVRVDAYEATGLAADNRVHALSVRRIAD
jgi:hypothetical protein